MTVPRWFIAVISIVAALAVGVAMAFVGANLASPSSTVAAPQPTALPIAQALRADGTPVGQTGTRFAATPHGPGSTSPGQAYVAAAVRAMMNGDTPSAAAAYLARRGLTPVPAATAGDPCSPDSGTPSADCPSGLHGTIESDTAVPGIVVTGQAFPPPQAQYTANGNPNGPIWCGAATATATSVPIGISSTVPANVAYQYYPTDHSAPSRSGELDFSHAQQATFETDLARDVPAESLPVDQHCVTLTGLRPRTEYTVLISAHDYLGRDAVVGSFVFNSSGAKIIPTASFAALGANVMSGVAYHLPDQTVQIRMFVVSGGDAPTCPVAHGEHIAAAYEEGTATDEEMNSLNYDLRYREAVGAGYIVPEGVNILMCARWYRAGAAHSWERDQPIYQVQQLLSSPNRIIPEVTVESVANPGGEILPNRAIEVDTHEGTECGRVTIGGPSGATLPALACDAGQQEHGNSYFVYGSGFWDPSDTPGSDVPDADLEVTALTLQPGAPPLTNGMEIMDASHGCLGACTLPPDQDYPISFPGPGGNTEGSAIVRVHWVEGNSDYLGSEWGVGPLQASSPAYVVPNIPQLDTTASFVVQDANLVTRTVTAGFTLSVDRAVNYTVTLTDPTGAPVCLRPGGVATLSGHTNGSLPIAFASLCLGASYQATVDLTDAAGRHSSWARTDAASWWSASRLTTPVYPAEITYNWGATGPSPAVLTDLRIRIGTNDLHAANQNNGTCVVGGMAYGQARAPAGLSEANTVYVTLRLSASGNWMVANCPPSNSATPSTVTVPVSLDDLTRAGGVDVTIPTLYGFHLHLQVASRT